MIQNVQERIQTRLKAEEYDAEVMDEVIQAVIDRLCLRLGVTEDTFPSLFHSIVVDASIKLWRKHYYEGVVTEKVDTLSTEFVTDILAEYQPEIDQWLNSAAANGSGSRKVVRFL